eukprot:gene5912-6599_t
MSKIHLVSVSLNISSVEKGSVTIYDGRNSSSILGKFLTSDSKHLNFVSSGNEVFIQYRAKKTNVMKGKSSTFKLKYDKYKKSSKKRNF